MSGTVVPRTKRLGVLLVKGLAPETPPTAIAEHFGRFADVNAVHIVKDALGESKGFAYVMLEDAKAAATVTAFEHRIQGQVVSVQIPSKKGRRRVCKSHALQKRLYVYKLPPMCTSEELSAVFGKFEGFLDARATIDSKTKELRPFGCVDFETADDVAKVITQPVFVRGVRIEISSHKRSDPELGVLRTFSQKDSSIFERKLGSPSMLKVSGVGLQRSESKNKLEEEVSNYQCLDLNPWVFAGTARCKLVTAYYDGWLETGMIDGHTQSQARKVRSMKVSNKLPDAWNLTVTGPSQGYNWVGEHQRKAVHLSSNLNQNISNYKFTIEPTQSFLQRLTNPRRVAMLDAANGPKTLLLWPQSMNFKKKPSNPRGPTEDSFVFEYQDENCDWKG